MSSVDQLSLGLVLDVATYSGPEGPCKHKDPRDDSRKPSASEPRSRILAVLIRCPTDHIDIDRSRIL